MGHWPWWVYSFIAAILWGLHFNLVARVSKVLPRDAYSALTIFLITSIAIFLLLPFLYQKLIGNLVVLWDSGNGTRVAVITLVFTALVATSSLYMAMQMSPNATVAALLDITYPLFIALIAWLLFKENHIDWSVLVGGGLIFAGVMLIIWKHG